MVANSTYCKRKSHSLSSDIYGKNGRVVWTWPVVKSFSTPSISGKEFVK